MFWLLFWIVLAQQGDFILEAEVNNLTPYVGEKITYTLRFYAYTTSNDDLELENQLPDFAGFWIGDRLSPENRQIVIINNVQYNLQEVLVEIMPLTPGVITIEPATLNIPETSLSDAITLETQSIEVTVRPLPSNPPEGFDGAVGQFSMLTDIDQSRVIVGEPIRLTADFQGAGNFEQLRAPNINLFAGDWQIFSNPADPATYGTNGISGLRLGQRTFEWLLIPQTSGSQQIPPLIFSYFDPFLEDYRTIESSAYDIEVFPGEGTPLIANRQPELIIKPVPNHLQRGSTGLFTGFWVIWLMFPLFAVFSGGWVTYRQIQANRIKASRYQSALKRAHQRLKEADSGLKIARIVYAYIADKQNISNREVTQNNWLDLLPADFQAEKLAACVAEAAGYQFTPDGASFDLQTLIKQAARLLGELDQAWLLDDSY